MRSTRPMCAPVCCPGGADVIQLSTAAQAKAAGFLQFASDGSNFNTTQMQGCCMPSWAWHNNVGGATTGGYVPCKVWHGATCRTPTPQRHHRVNLARKQGAALLSLCV